MEIIKTYECKKRINGAFQIYVKVVALHNNKYYLASWKDRKQLPHQFSQLEDIKLIRTESRGPALRSRWTTATPDNGRWLKKPEIEDFLDMNLEAQMAHEIEMCEFMRQHHHPHLALYYGCLADNGRATGLIFQKYETTLLERVNPQRLSKRDFMASGRPLVMDYMRDWVKSLRDALDHLHNLCLVHNDITPANIMLDEGDVPAMIDFGGLCHIGDSLQHTRRTMGWHDEAVTHAMQSNDTDALAELKVWLFGSAEDLKFI